MIVGVLKINSVQLGIVGLIEPTDGVSFKIKSKEMRQSNRFYLFSFTKFDDKNVKTEIYHKLIEGHVRTWNVVKLSFYAAEQKPIKVMARYLGDGFLTNDNYGIAFAY